MLSRTVDARLSFGQLRSDVLPVKGGSALASLSLIVKQIHSLGMPTWDDVAALTRPVLAWAALSLRGVGVNCGACGDDGKFSPIFEPKPRPKPHAACKGQW